MDVSHVIYFRRDLGLTTEHTIDHGGKIYEVQGFQDASAGLSVIWKATVLHRTDGAK
jgi:CYTH domain-containing protein